MKEDLQIRKAHIRDLDSILRLNLLLFKKEYADYDKSLNLKWTYGKGRKYFKNRIIKKDGFVKIAEAGRKVVGYLCGGISKRLSYRKKARYVELENMFIEKRFRSRGIGAKLMRDFINWCKKNKVQYVSVKASAGNKKALDFYRKFRFKDYDMILELSNFNK